LYFLDPRIKSYGCLKFLGEVWAGRACVGANEEQLINQKTIWRQEEGGKGTRGYKNGGPVGSQLAAIDRAPSNSQQPLVDPSQVTAG
jgi:hypothetical protein